MVVEKAFGEVWLAAIVGFGFLCLSEFFLQPKPRLIKPWASYCALIGLWGTVYSLLVFITGRPWCSMAAGLAMDIILVVVNNAKYKSLREPFLFQDYDYFLDTLRFPRLFLPFLGWKSFCEAALFCCVAIWGFMCEQPPNQRWDFAGQFGAVLFVFVFSLFFLWLAIKYRPKISIEPQKDFKRLGFIPFIFAYGLESRKNFYPRARFPNPAKMKPKKVKSLHLVAIQSESFFDVRKLFAGIRPGLLSVLDDFRNQALLGGDLIVPAWGANTVRTECAFLTAIPPAELGIHRFNPYQTIFRKKQPMALPAYLHALGYNTICLHPYYGSFYNRNKIFPGLGFDTFLDYKYFTDCEKAGPYVGDNCLAKKILEILDRANRPTFIFAISMENHGPLHLEEPLPAEENTKFFDILPSHGCLELSIYLNHILHTAEMLAILKEQWKESYPVSLCFYGDHVPIMPTCYSILGIPSGHVPYFCWSNKSVGENLREDIHVSSLSIKWLQLLNLLELRQEY